MRTHTLILNWNGAELSRACLATISAHERVTVVDNGSTDGSLEKLSGWEILKLPHNLGFARGMNEGIRYALREGADRVVLLNNDTLLAPDTIRELHETMGTDVGIAGPVSYYAGAPTRVWASGGGVVEWTGVRWHTRDVPDQVVDRAYMPAVCWMVRREVFEKVGLLPSEYGAYFEDLEFCLRVRRAGWRVVCAPRSRLWHKVSMSSGGESSPRVKFLASRNRFLFVRRMGFKYCVPIVGAIHAAEFVFRLLTGDVGRAGAVFRGSLRGISGPLMA